MKRTVTIGGLHGTGKSCVADRIAKHFGLRRVSAGVIFRTLAKEKGYTLEEFSIVAEGNEEIDRELDARQKAEAEKGNLVMDGQLAGWMAGENADFRVMLTAPVDVRVKRIANRDAVDFESAKHETMTREQSEKERYFEYYGIDVSDLSIYDLIVNTDKFELDGVVAVVRSTLEIFFGQGKK